jgi:tRNA A-37 threonylcarbamoyl transferase component Bud32
VGLSIRPALRAIDVVDLAALRGIVRVRNAPMTHLMLGLQHLGSVWVARVLAWTTLVALVALRRFRHLVVYLTMLLLVSLFASVAAVAIGRMRPAGVTILGDWDGYAYPSRPIAVLGIVLVGVVLTLVPGKWRSRAIYVALTPLLALCAARLYLAVDHPTDVLAAFVLGWVVAILAFRLAVPEEVFPVRYTRGAQRAHLELDDSRREAIVRALAEQLDLRASSVEHFRLAGSAGSTPLRIGVQDAAGRETRVLFAKLYALSHLRSDRWYKLVRTVLYGRLEDEKPFSTVRRLVEYEDHMLRLLRDAGLPTPVPYGFVEITPEREYLIVMEFFEDATEITEAKVDNRVIDEALTIVRRMWDVGVAHRDLKPSNLLVCDGRVLLIDVAFATVRPTPWRQAVDLANMMLTLALCTTAERVYERALNQFSPDDVAEAFAASRGITLPSQLRTRLRADGSDLLGSFRALAPDRRPIPIQLWSVRRVGLTVGVVATLALGALILVASAHAAGLL